jgi:hypothetical protein
MRDQNGPTLIEKADALLYLGPRAGFTLAMPPAGTSNRPISGKSIADR